MSDISFSTRTTAAGGGNGRQRFMRRGCEHCASFYYRKPVQKYALPSPIYSLKRPERLETAKTAGFQYRNSVPSPIKASNATPLLSFPPSSFARLRRLLLTLLPLQQQRCAPFPALRPIPCQVLRSPNQVRHFGSLVHRACGSSFAY